MSPQRRPEQYLTPAFLLLVRLADGLPRHGYLLSDELVDTTGWRPPASTISDALTRLERDGLIEARGPRGRQKPYQITEAGREELDFVLALATRLVRDGRATLKEWRDATGRTGDTPARQRSRVDAEVPEQLLQLLDQAADRGGQAKSEIVTKALTRALRQPPPKIACPVCGEPTRLTGRGKVWAHDDPRTSQRCAGTAADASQLPHLPPAASPQT
jgi:DNA-binding PadR family transcriptional regulator